MSSRAEEKARRKAEREAAEQEAAKRQKRARVLQIAGGGVLAAALIAGVIAIAVAGGDGTAENGDGPEQASANQNVSLPPQQDDTLEAALEGTTCELKEFPSEGAEHIADSESFADYESNPPTSGTHRITPAADGVYEPGNSPAVENWVHTLEHGRILFQYAPGTSEQRIQQLEALIAEEVNGAPGGYHALVFQNNTDMPYAVAAVNWTRFVGCKEFTDETFDVLRAFRAEYTDVAPEQVP